MDHPDFIACSFMENSIGLKRARLNNTLHKVAQDLEKNCQRGSNFGYVSFCS